MFFKQIDCGGDRNYGYIIGDENAGKCALVDPSPSLQGIMAEVHKNNMEIIYVINTHDHYDHTGGNEEIKRISDARIVFHSSSAKGDIKVHDNDVLRLGEIELQIIHTPGHTKDSICILTENRLMTGDTLFVGKVGGTYGRKSAMEEFESLKRLMSLDDNITVWPGHNYGVRNSSTIKDERETNPFCTRLDNFQDFYDLKENWAEYKRKHGIE